MCGWPASPSPPRFHKKICRASLRGWAFRSRKQACQKSKTAPDTSWITRRRRWQRRSKRAWAGCMGKQTLAEKSLPREVQKTTDAFRDFRESRVNALRSRRENHFQGFQNMPGAFVQTGNSKPDSPHCGMCHIGKFWLLVLYTFVTKWEAC